MFTFLSHQFVHLKLIQLIDLASAILLIEIKTEKAFLWQNETNSNVNQLIFAKYIVNSDTLVKKHVGTTVLGTKIQKPLAILLKLYLETKGKEGDTRIHTSSYVTVAAFATKSN